MNDTVDRFYQATGELMVKAADYDTLSARCAELERRLAGAWCVRELEWTHEKQRKLHPIQAGVHRTGSRSLRFGGR